jgi:hypothetical protein
MNHSTSVPSSSSLYRTTFIRRSRRRKLVIFHRRNTAAYQHTGQQWIAKYFHVFSRHRKRVFSEHFRFSPSISFTSATYKSSPQNLLVTEGQTGEICGPSTQLKFFWKPRSITWLTVWFAISRYDPAIWKILRKWRTSEAMHVWRNTETRSRNHWCSGKAISITDFSVCVCVDALARVCACARLALLIKYDTRRRDIVCGLWHHRILRHYVTNGTIFEKKKVIEHKTCVLVWCTIFVWNISHVKKISARYYHKRT